MKPFRFWLYPLVLIAGFCAAQTDTAQIAQTPQATPISVDSAPATRITISEDSLLPVVAQPELELLPPTMFKRAAALLVPKGVNLPKSQIVAMGFEPLTPEAQKAIFVFIAIDASGQPIKSVYETSIEVYRALTGKPDSVQEPVLGLNDPNTPLSDSKSLRQDGRVYFMINSTLKSLWVYPINLGRAFNEIDGRVLAGISLLTLGGSLYGSYAFTKDRELGYGRVEFMNYGGDLGGIICPSLLGAALKYDNNQLSAWTGIIGFPAGIYVGSKVRFTGNFQYGNASIMTSMSKFAFLYGYMLPFYFTQGFDDPAYSQWGAGLTLALLPVGFYAGHKLVGDKDYSSGRSVLISTTGIMGALTGAFFPTIFEETMFGAKDKELIATTTMAGHVLGTYLGFNFRPDERYTFGQGLFIAISALTGACVADAIPLIAQSESHQVYTVFGMIGAWSGLVFGEYLSRSLFENSARDKRISASITFPGLAESVAMLIRQKLNPSAAPRKEGSPDFVERANLVEVRF